MSSHIKRFLPQLLGMNENWKTTLLTQWPTIIGTLKDKVVLEKIEGDTIILGVFHPAWIQELSFLKPILLQAINDHLDQPYIKNIKIKTSSVPRNHNATRKKTIQSPVIAYTLSTRENRALDAIKDQELKKTLSLFLQRCVNKQ